MFYYIKGTVAHIEPERAVIDCGGVGYDCATSSYTLSSLNLGKVAKLYTYLHVREDVFNLYGFASEIELECFKLLLSVSGVGPKAALSILSANSPEQFAMAVITGEEKALTVAQGIGKKTAQRIILELKDKLSKEQQKGGWENISVSNNMQGASKSSDAAAALAVLGYSSAEVSMALRGLAVETLSLEELIRQALKRLNKFQ
ncbi:MAG: Holliday junction branch migration protein RuvA [Oscillospiraceae bacterium]|nr:Holliday junction branch migration protein RuvA [Oscillospiraceae bacterium]